MEMGPGIPFLGIPQGDVCPLVVPLSLRTPPGPWQGSLVLVTALALLPGPRSHWPPPRPPSARAWRSPGGLAGSAPGLASRGLAPPEGLGPGNH